MLSVLCRAWVFACAGLACSAGAAEDLEPLHKTIDRLVERRADELAPAAADAEFLRRAYLDLAGRIPSIGEARAFLADPLPAKREALLEVLLAGPELPRRMAEHFHAVLMERRGDNPEWQAYLNRSFSENKPWNVLAREILCPNPADPATRASAFFYTKRLEHYGENPIDYPRLTRDVGRLFLGVDLQCAQCHDHLFINDYKQADFQGLFAAYRSLEIFGDAPFPAVKEKPSAAKLEFASVFDKAPRRTGPRAPGGREIEVPSIEAAKEEARPDKAKLPPAPAFSVLERLAGEITEPGNRAFARAISNRIWWMLMGRGLVHPLDLHHRDNPPSNPELLELLADRLISRKFDLRWLVSEITKCRAYSQSGERPPDAPPLPAQTFRAALEKRLSPEQLLRSLLQATGPPGIDPRNEKGAGELEKRLLKALANPPGEPEVDVAPSLKGALFWMNDSLVLGLLEPRPGNLIERAEALPGAVCMPRGAVEELYLSILTRFPTEEERAEAAGHLERSGAERRRALQDLAWALLASAEFSMNH